MESSVEPGTVDETAESNVESLKADEKRLGSVTEMPTVSVTAEDAATGTAAEENLLPNADDSASMSSLLLDSTMTSNVDISLLDDPFIAIGADCEKDSLLEEQNGDTDWTADDSQQKGLETAPMTSSPDSFSGEKAESLEVASASADDSAVVDTVEDRDSGPAAVSSADDGRVA